MLPLRTRVEITCYLCAPRWRTASVMECAWESRGAIESARLGGVARRPHGRTRSIVVREKWRLRMRTSGRQVARVMPAAMSVARSASSSCRRWRTQRDGEAIHHGDPGYATAQSAKRRADDHGANRRHRRWAIVGSYRHRDTGGVVVQRERMEPIGRRGRRRALQSSGWVARRCSATCRMRERSDTCAGPRGSSK